MHYHQRRIWHVPDSRHTPEAVYAARKLHRRRFLAAMGMGAAGLGLSSLVSGCHRATDTEVLEAGKVDLPETLGERADDPAGSEYDRWEEAKDNKFGARRNPHFEYGRPETKQEEAARYTNFYEFSGGKANFAVVDDFEPHPWKFEVTGECGKPQTFDIDDIYKMMPFEERAYRHRCVETWAMCVPWTGFPLSKLLEKVEPSSGAKFVALQTFDVPNEADEKAGLPTFDGPNMSSVLFSYPWPYTEGLTIEEAMNDLAFIATGIYGQPLAKQHGAPIRLVVPWKYGFKSCKSIVRITLTKEQPATFWNTYMPHEYGFTANVDPEVPHPRWSQETEWMLGTMEKHPTQKYNGYGEHVAELYRA